MSATKEPSIGFLEAKPGLSPTTRHLQGLVERMKSEGVKVILTSPYFDIRHAQFVSKQTAAKIVPLAHQVGAPPGADDYIKMIHYNVKQWVRGFKSPETPDCTYYEPISRTANPLKNKKKSVESFFEIYVIRERGSLSMLVSQ